MGVAIVAGGMAFLAAPPPVTLSVAPKAVAVSSKSTALIIVDMQNDFCRPEGKLYVGPSCARSIPHIKYLLDRARGAGIPIIYTQDWHAPDDPEFKVWPPHCIMNTWGSEIVDELKPSERDYIVRKGGKPLSYDCWFASYEPGHLERILESLGVDTLIIAGTVSNICVYHAVAGAAMRGYRVVVPIDCISALSDYGQELAIFQFSSVYRAEITNSTSITFE